LPDNQEHITTKLHQYKVKFLKKKLLEGGVIFLGTALLVYLTINGLEAIGRFGSIIRALLLITFLVSSGTVLFLHIVKPLSQLFKTAEVIADEEAASRIGDHFPNLGDKLLNYIQLSSKPFAGSSLAKASLSQRAGEMTDYSFIDAVSFAQEKRKLLQYVLPLLLLLVILMVVFPTGIIGSSKRIFHFNQAYVPQAPFSFDIPTELIAFRNENFLLQVSLIGEAIPQEAYFIANDRKIKLTSAGFGTFELIFPNITSSKNFIIEAASYKSKAYILEVVDRPSLSKFSVSLKHPAYLRMPDETFQNIGSFEVPEGTDVAWNINTRFADKLLVYFDKDSTSLSAEDNQSYIFHRQVLKNQPYRLELRNDYGRQQGTINYEIKVIKDRPPYIETKVLVDTVLYKYVVFAGNLADDHGIKSLKLNYSVNNSSTESIVLPIDIGSTSQSLLYHWVFDSLHLESGDQLQYYLQVTDNDAINNYKSTRSKLFYLDVPNEKEALAQLEKSKNDTKEQITDMAEEAKELKENIDRLVEQLKGKKELSWQEEQMLENLVEQKKKLTEDIKTLQEKNKILNEQQKKFEDTSPDTQQKQQQLQELFDELMDEETKKLYEELQKLLESFENTESVQDILDKIQNKELNLEQELERALEFFKQLQYQQKLDEARAELDNILEEQKELLAETDNKSIDSDTLANNQGKLNEDFKEFQEKLNEAKDLNQELKRPNMIENTSGEEKEVNEEQNKSKDNLIKGDRNKSKKSQKNASDKIEEIGRKLEQMRSSMMMQQMQEDLGDLQAILSNLVELSFDQEELMLDFKKINQSDPAFIGLSQEQLSLKEDSKIINDSLQSLASRVMAIASFITRELNEMNQNMDTSIKAIRDRKRSDAIVSQQLTMTSVNNLALMLDNVMRQMQENMARAMGQGEDSEGEQQVPGLSDMQKKLNEQIRELGQSGKSGRELSEELAKLAAEQERIRKALEEAEKKYGGDQGEIGKMMQQMEDTELDLVNKNLSRQTMQRQQQILTRMLEAEKAMRERELDTKREAKSATQYDKMLPKVFEDYVKQREKEIELLKTMPPRLVPFFKIEVGEYFDRVKQQSEGINN